MTEYNNSKLKISSCLNATFSDGKVLRECTVEQALKERHGRGVTYSGIIFIAKHATINNLYLLQFEGKRRFTIDAGYYLQDLQKLAKMVSDMTFEEFYKWIPEYSKQSQNHVPKSGMVEETDVTENDSVLSNTTNVPEQGLEE